MKLRYHLPVGLALSGMFYSGLLAKAQPTDQERDLLEAHESNGPQAVKSFVAKKMSLGQICVAASVLMAGGILLLVVKRNSSLDSERDE